MRGLRDAAANAATLFVGLCTVALAALAFGRHFGARATRIPLAEPHPPVLLEEWPGLLAEGHYMGPADADVVVVVFCDFLCPACASFATQTYPALRDRYPGRVALVYRHWPLSRHWLTHPAVRAAECAADQGRFAEFHDLLFTEHGAVTRRSFRDFAVQAGVEDIGTFDSCYWRNDAIVAVERDTRKARRLGGIGTPTVVVNGWLLVGGVSLELLDSIAKPYLLTEPSGPDRTSPREGPRAEAASPGGR
jgi:predicted DsbA family dithiol-disulfide isomerase